MKIYFAGKLRHANIFRDIVKYNRDIIATSCWIDIPDLENKDATGTDGELKVHWLNDQYGVKICDCLIAYGEEEDVLSGTIIEIGMALALGKPIILVGSNPAFSKTWSQNRDVFHVYTLLNAVILARKLTYL